MARKVFFSFKYADAQRAMVVRNSNVISSDDKVGFIDKADFEAVKRKGDAAIKAWIDGQLSGTSVTVVLVGSRTNQSKWVAYEISESIKKGNGILTVDISQIKGFDGAVSTWCGMTVPGYPNYQWFNGNGHDNVGKWIDDAAKKAGR